MVDTWQLSWIYIDHNDLFIIQSLNLNRTWKDILSSSQERKEKVVEEDMHSVKEKVSNAAAAAKEHVDIFKANTQEKVEKAGARTKEEKDIAEERRKAKEAEAKMELHESKAAHAGEKLQGKHAHHHVHGGPAPYSLTPTTATNPLGGHDHHVHPNNF